MRWQTSQSSSSVAKPQEHKPMALAVRASGALGKLGVDSAHARLDRRADGRAGPGKGVACR